MGLSVAGVPFVGFVLVVDMTISGLSHNVGDCFWGGLKAAWVKCRPRGTWRTNWRTPTAEAVGFLIPPRRARLEKMRGARCWQVPSTTCRFRQTADPSARAEALGRDDSVMAGRAGRPRLASKRRMRILSGSSGQALGYGLGMTSQGRGQFTRLSELPRPANGRLERGTLRRSITGWSGSKRLTL